MRCKCCNKIMMDWEMTKRKVHAPQEYEDMCTACLKTSSSEDTDVAIVEWYLGTEGGGDHGC